MVIPEAESIPYEPNDLRGERLLVLAPHPDDEVIGCGGLIALHTREHRAVSVVVATDGAEAGDVAVRQEESRKGLHIVGAASIEFLGFRDRQLERDLPALKTKLRTIIDAFNPDLIAVPSPVEIHPDHVALARAVAELVQSDSRLFANHATTRIAFYEVSAPLRPNTLVDISSVSDLKYSAVAAHASQRAVRDYSAYIEGLNAYRGITLPPEVKYAEGYWVTPLPALRTIAFSTLRNIVGAPKPIEVVAEPLPISVVIRTKDRPALLAEAVASVRHTGYPAEVVVVNDGGEKPNISDATVINHDKARGRSEAMNAGVRAAKSHFVAFLDDDDLFYPEHLATLSAAARSAEHVAWYTDAISAFVREGVTHSRLRIYSQDFDRELLLLDNYIPLVTLLAARDAFLEVGGFDPQFELFEDWDFLIRLSQRGSFEHIPRVTCEIRHIEGVGSIIVDAPEGSSNFREAKLQVWRKHASLIDNNVIANVLERQKRNLNQATHETVDVRGERDHLRGDFARLEREKAGLIAELSGLHGRIAQLEGANAELRVQIAAADADRYEKSVRLGDLQTAHTDLVSAHEEAKRTSNALYVEVARLQTLLDMIYESRTWKLHTIVEKMKGRG